MMKKYLLAKIIFLSFFVNLTKAQSTYTWNAYPASGLSYSTTNMTATVTTIGTPNWNTSILPSTLSPAYITTFGGGLDLNVNWANLTSSVTLNIVFACPVPGPVTFTINDINSNNNSAIISNMFIDKVTITGQDAGGTTIYPTITGPSTACSISGANNNIATGITGSATAGSGLNNISFSGTVKQITIVYASGPTLYTDPTSPYTDAGLVAQANTNPRDQRIVIGTINTGNLVAITAPTSVTASNASVCSGAATTLTAVGGSSTTQWYTGSCGGTLVGTGNSITVNPTTATTYYAANVKCDGTLTTCTSTSISINPSAVAPTSIASSLNPSCSGNAVTLNATGANASSQWYSGSCGGTLVGTGTSISVSPTSTTTYYVRNNNACGNSACASIVQTVNSAPSPPTFVSSSQANSCSGANVTLTALGTNSSSQWFTGSCGGTFVGTGSFINVAPNSNTTYYVQNTNGCGNSSCISINQNIITTPNAPTSISTSLDNSCATANITLNANGSNGTTQWFTGSCGGTLIGSGASIVVSPSTTTTYYALNSNSCGSSACVNFIQNVQPNISAPSSISASQNNTCSGTSVTLTANGSTGTTSWYDNACGGNLIGTGSTITVSPTSNTTYYASNSNTCGSSSCANITQTIINIPVAPISISSSQSSSCAGSTVTLTAVGGSASTQWFSGSCGGSLIGTGISINVSPNTATTYFAQNSNICGASSCASYTQNIITNPTAPTSISSSQNNSCSGSTITLSATGTSGTTEWHVGSCNGTLIGTGTTLSVAPTDTTVYYVLNSGSCGISPCTIFTQNVIAIPNAPISISSSQTNACAGTQSTLTISGNNGTTNWHTDSCNGALIGTGLSVNITPLTNTVYYASNNNTCGASSCVSYTQLVTQTPSTPIITSSNASAICPGDNATLTGTSSNGTINWYSSYCGGTFIGTGNSINIIPSQNTTYYSTAVNICGVSGCDSIQQLVNSSVTSPSNITASQTYICSTNNTVTLTVNNGNANSEWFIGSCGNTLIGTGSTINVTVPTNVDSVVYFVRNTGTCGFSNCVSYTIYIRPTPLVSIIGDSSICSNATILNYSNNLINGVTYNWSINGGTIVGNQNTNAISVDWTGTSGGNITLTMTDTLSSCSSTFTENIIQELPINPTLSGPTNVCLPSINNTYTSQSQVGYAYTWSANNGTIISGQSTNIIDINWLNAGNTSVLLNVYDSVSGCAGNTLLPVSINNIASPTIFGDTLICAGTLNELYSTTNGYNATWLITNGSVNSVSNDSIFVNWNNSGNATITLTVLDTITGCSASSNQNVNIAPLPNPIIQGSIAVCSNNLNINYNTLNVNGNSYNWIANNGIITNGQNSNNIFVNWNSIGSQSLILIETDLTNGCSDTATININVNQAPSIDASASIITNASCGNSNASISGIIVSGGIPSYTYIWTDDNGSVISVDNIGSINNLHEGNYTLIITDANSCSDTVVPPFHIANINNVIANFTTDSIFGTAPLNVSFTNTSQNASTYSWDFQDGTNQLSTIDANHTFFNNGYYDVILTATDTNGCYDTASVRIYVEIDFSISIPNIFSPNDDGSNDVFKVLSKGSLKDLDCTIYNRWGEIIYTYTGVQNGWDGRTISGSSASEGVYYYLINITSLLEVKTEYKGSLTLVK